MGQMDVALAPVVGGFQSLGNYMWVFWIFIGLAVVGGGLFLIAYWRKSGDEWNVLIRIRQEDNQTGKIYLDPIEIRGKKVTMSNNLRLIFLEKEILGKRLLPLLNFHTRPGIYDLVITSDNRIFIITGIDGISEQRKTLKVGLRYPGIDYALEEVNRDHAKLNQLDRRSDLLGIVKAASIAVIAIVIMVIFIIGMQNWTEAKRIDASISESELRLFENINEYQLKQVEQTNAMILLTDKLERVMGTDNLRSSLQEVGAP